MNPWDLASAIALAVAVWVLIDARLRRTRAREAEGARRVAPALIEVRTRLDQVWDCHAEQLKRRDEVDRDATELNNLATPQAAARLISARAGLAECELRMLTVRREFGAAVRRLREVGAGVAATGVASRAFGAADELGHLLAEPPSNLAGTVAAHRRAAHAVDEACRACDRAEALI